MTRVQSAPGFDRVRLGLGVLLALMLGISLWITWMLVVWSRHIGGIETALARADPTGIPALRQTGERELDRIIGALNEAGRRLAGARRESEALALRVTTAERLAAIGRVAAGVAHEIRNPIVALRLQGENALAGDDARRQGAIGDMLEQVARVDGLVAELLSMTQHRKAQPTQVAVGPFLSTRIVRRHRVRHQLQRVRHQLQSEHLLLLAAEKRQDAVRRQFSQGLAEFEIVRKLGAGLRLARSNSRTETAARPHFFAQGPDQRGVFAETFNQDRAGAFECGGRISHALARFDIPTSQLLRALVGPREKRLCQRLEARFACDLGLRPPLRPIRQIEILEPRLAVRRVDRLLERGVEFSLLADAVEDSGPTLVELAQIAQPLFGTQEQEKFEGKRSTGRGWRDLP
jgi:signal transduction histidine kinase